MGTVRISPAGRSVGPVRLSLSGSLLFKIFIGGLASDTFFLLLFGRASPSAHCSGKPQGICSLTVLLRLKSPHRYLPPVRNNCYRPAFAGGHHFGPAGTPTLYHFPVRMPKDRPSPDRDNGDLRSDGTNKSLGRRRTAAVMRHFYYIRFQIASCLQQNRFRLSFDITGKQK